MHQIILASSGLPDVDASSVESAGRAILTALLGIALLWLCIRTLMSSGRNGDLDKSFRIFGSCLIILALIPLGAAATGYGQVMLDFIMSLLTFGQ